MEIQEKLLQFKTHILSAVGLGVAILFVCYLAPSLLGVVKYFWPLLMSTGLFLVAIVVVGRLSPPVAEAHGEKVGEGLLNYVASEPEHIHLFQEGREGVGAH